MRINVPHRIGSDVLASPGLLQLDATWPQPLWVFLFSVITSECLFYVIQYSTVLRQPETVVQSNGQPQTTYYPMSRWTMIIKSFFSSIVVVNSLLAAAEVQSSSQVKPPCVLYRAAALTNLFRLFAEHLANWISWLHLPPDFAVAQVLWLYVALGQRK
jgi:hypothetical protein